MSGLISLTLLRSEFLDLLLQLHVLDLESLEFLCQLLAGSLHSVDGGSQLFTSLQ